MGKPMVALALGVALTTGCASGADKEDGAGFIYQPTEESTGSSGSETQSQTSAGESCATGCQSPPSACFDAIGQCIDGACQYTPLAAGEACGDGECGGAGQCDGAGACVGGSGGPCERPHAVGTCRGGACGAWSCDAGWGNCNDDWNDGCELPLDSATDCGACGVFCEAGPHATAMCSAGSCQQSCDDPWENCDDDWDNGCEIPTGVANQCDASGLNAVDGCWTAYCGSSNDADATNFGTFYCMDCANCHEPEPGMCQWCAHGPGVWYPTDVCGCGAYEDLACG